MESFVLPDWKQEYDDMVVRNALVPDEIIPNGPFNFYPYRHAFENHVRNQNAYVIRLHKQTPKGVRQSLIGAVCMSLSGHHGESHRVHLDLFWIHTQWRGNGYGALFVREFLEPLCRRHNKHILTLEAVDNNIGFWQDRCGFTPCDKSVDAFFSVDMFKQLK
jgi:GNAT superfamily N-acetyltransferase